MRGPIPDRSRRLTEAQLEARLTMLERMMQSASAKEIPGLVATYQRVLDELVALDLARGEGPN